MKFSFHKQAPAWLLLIVSTSFLWYMYQEVILHPNAFLFNDSGDAIKNYFTYAAQSKAETWIQSSIMNYPYGETLFYLDCHPLLTWILQGLDSVFPGITYYSIGIIHILMILSLFLSAVILYLIFSKLHINRWWAVIGAFGIMVMSPQVFRMTGHLALSYTVFIPLTWYLTIRFSKSQNKLLWSVLICVNISFWYLIHAYLGMIAVSFVAMQLFAEMFIFKTREFNIDRKWIHFSIQVLIPALFFWSLVTLTDHHIGRTTNPWGFFTNNANLQTVFLPHHGILHRWLDPIINFDNQNWEGRGYIGLTSTLIFILLLTGWIQKKRKKSTDLTILFEQVGNQFILRKALFASFVLLLFSMAFPFNLGFQFLLDWIPVIKKFRGNGRFAWVFYYVMTVATVFALHYIYYYVRISRLPHFLIKLMAVLLLFLFIGEGWSYHQDVTRQYGRLPNTFTPVHLPSYYQDGLEAMDSSQFQAILPLPYYHKGSENFAVEGTDKTYRTSMTMAYHTQLPIWGSYATHTSIPEAKNSLQTLSPDFYDKAIQKDITSGKDVVIVYSKDPLNRYEQEILEKGERFFTHDQYELYRLPVNRIFESSANEKIDSFQRRFEEGRIYKMDEFYSTDSTSCFLHEGFDDSPTLYHVSGKGAYKGELGDRKALLTVPAGILNQNKIYNLSFWFSNFGKNFGQDITNVKVRINEVMDNGDRKMLLEQRPASSMVIDGDWSLVEMEFSPHNTDHSIEIYLRGPWKKKGAYYIDELFLREKEVNVYRVLQPDGDMIKGLMMNNQRIWVE